MGKLFTFAYTWSIGGNFKRQEDVDEDDTVNRRADGSPSEPEMNICNEFDGFMHDVFDVEPPLGKFLAHLLHRMAARQLYWIFVVSAS